MMNRRDFIKLITAAVAGGAVLDVERLLWVPKPMFVVPALPMTPLPPVSWKPLFHGGSWIEMMNHEMLDKVAGTFPLAERMFTPELSREMRRGLLSEADILELAEAAHVEDRIA